MGSLHHIFFSVADRDNRPACDQTELQRLDSEFLSTRESLREGPYFSRASYCLGLSSQPGPVVGRKALGYYCGRSRRTGLVLSMKV